MYNVCIADDEILIQKSISARLRSSGIPVRVCGCADNAKSAISLYWDSKPDIFFVDINMPGMDGLSLIRRIREEDPACMTIFIIITGYDDFLHLREAIQSGVMDYLKKPISTEEFNTALAKAEKIIQQEQKKSHENQDGIVFYDEYLSDPPQTINSGTFIAIYSPNAETLIRTDDIIYAFSNFSEGNFRLSFKGIDTLRLYHIPDLKVSERTIHKSVNELLANKGFFLVYTYPESQKIDVLADKIEQTMNKRFFNSGITECFQESVVSQVDTGILNYALEHGQIDTCRAALKVYFDEMSRKETFCQELSPFYRNIVLFLINKYAAHQMPIPDSIKMELSLFAICRYPTLDSLRARLNGMVLSLAQKIGIESRSGELIHNVCEFLKQNYAEELTLNDLARHFYVSPPYLSRRFRKKTGITFVEYLEDIRMDKAKEYLTNSEVQIADVSEQVGYLDPAYFAKVFKRKYRMSPSEYRFQNKS